MDVDADREGVQPGIRARNPSDDVRLEPVVIAVRTSHVFVRRVADIREDLDRVFAYFPRLAERKHQKAGTFSGGEQQMLAIGRALMSHPRILMFDEPSLGLAPILVDQIAEIIKEIHAAGTTVLLVEQNAFLALTLSESCYVLDTGEVSLAGPSAELLENEHVKYAYLGTAQRHKPQS